MEQANKYLSPYLAICFFSWILGACLLISGNIFLSLHWPDSFQGKISGLVIIALSCIILLFYIIYISFKYNVSSIDGAYILSDKSTLFVKYFLPYFFMNFWSVASILTFFSPYKEDLFIPVSAFSFVLMGLMFIFSTRIKFIYIINKKVIVSDGKANIFEGYDYKIYNNVILSFVRTDKGKFFFIPQRVFKNI
jgi:hypothetical protein